jgi:long-chain acyl-CoA synthetase
MGQEGQRRLWSWSADDVYILSGPAYHAGPGGWAMTALFVGATTVILPAWDARSWLSLVDQHRVTRSFMVPAHFIRLLEIPEQERRRFDLSSLELIVHAAAPCPVEIKRRTIEWLDHVEISELYGASEGGATKITSHEWLARPGSVGTPWPGVEIHILDPAGREQPAGEHGLIFVKPAGGARFEYHDDPDKTAGAWRDQGFTVGDIGYVDDGGYLFITDRATDMIIRGGVNIYPREIEDALYRHPAVVDCAVFGVPDSRSGEAIKAVVETRADVTIEELQSHCRAVLAKYKCPQIVELVGTLPRDPSGKVLKRLLREEHWKDRPTRIG